MESYEYVDNIKQQKANALARYRAYTNITKLFQIIEVFIAVALISWSSSHLPLVLKLSGEYVTSLSSYFMNQHVVFLVGNLIVVVCYVLSRDSDSGNEFEFEFHSDDGKYRRLSRRITNSADLTAKSVASVASQVIRSPEPSDCNEKSVTGVYSDDGEYRRLLHRKTTSDDLNAKSVTSQAITSAKTSEMQTPMIPNNKSVQKTVKTVTGETEMRQIERFQRTISEKVKSEIPVKSRRELRRSVTEMRRSEAAVEKLSNEEFRIRVEAFIMKQQRFLKQQSMLVDEC